jgi:cellulose synthase/poly-beta-1,6-N-acetylglucosamine synthase-like glycosyltransferase
MLFLEALFWTAAGLLVFVYAGYPALVASIARVRPNPPRPAEITPAVTIVIAAYNEARVIAATLRNKLQLDYPKDRLQIVVVSDGSTDGTDDIVQGFVDRGIQYLRQEPRNGKTAALNRAVELATGEIVVFSDANSIYAPQALRRLVAVFADTRVGYATGSLAYQTEGGSLSADGCGTYMRYENAIRRAETRVGSVVGVNGGLDAVRRSLYAPMLPHDLPDLVLPLRVIESGSRVVYVPEALFAEPALTASRDEYRMRVRVALRSLWTLYDMHHLLSLRRYGFYAFQLWAHKVLRYLAPIFIFLAAVTSFVLAPTSPVYAIAAALQVLFALAALAGFAAERNGRGAGLLYVPFYFALVNVAALHALWRFLKKERHHLWIPRLG